MVTVLKYYVLYSKYPPIVFNRSKITVLVDGHSWKAVTAAEKTI